MWASHFVRNGNKLSISSWLTTEVQVCQNVGRPNSRPPNLVYNVTLFSTAYIRSCICVNFCAVLNQYLLTITAVEKFFYCQQSGLGHKRKNKIWTTGRKEITDSFFDISCSHTLMVDARLYCAQPGILLVLISIKSCDYKVSFLENMSVPAFYFEQAPTSQC